MKRDRSATPPHLRRSEPVANAALYVEALEGELIRNSALESRTTERSNQPPGLLEWSGDPTQWIDRSVYPLSSQIEGMSIDPISSYDIFNLLTTLPQIVPGSPTRSDGFSDMPSDGEEMFYFEQGVRDEIEREKKKRRMESARLERIRLFDEREGEGSGTVVDEEVSPSRIHQLSFGGTTHKDSEVTGLSTRY